MNKIFLNFSFGILLLLLVAPRAFAHIVVKPSEAGIASYQTFTVGVPSESQAATVGLKILVPNGVKNVTPNVKPGWSIEVKKIGDKVSEINWIGGSIPSGQRDDFAFSAQVPAKETTLVWKAYQTYDNGEVVEWIHSPTSASKEADFPYSTTSIINDLGKTPASVPQKNSDIPLGTIAIALSAVALAVSLQKRNSQIKEKERK
jgi:uncharacterized protein YcnI